MNTTIEVMKQAQVALIKTSHTQDHDVIITTLTAEIERLSKCEPVAEVIATGSGFVGGLHLRSKVDQLRRTGQGW